MELNILSLLLCTTACTTRPSAAPPALLREATISPAVLANPLPKCMAVGRTYFHVPSRGGIRLLAPCECIARSEARCSTMYEGTRLRRAFAPRFRSRNRPRKAASPGATALAAEGSGRCRRCYGEMTIRCSRRRASLWGNHGSLKRSVWKGLTGAAPRAYGPSFGMPSPAPACPTSTRTASGTRSYAWSQNLGHENVLTTFVSYGPVETPRQGEIIRRLGAPQVAALADVGELARALAMRAGRGE